MLTFEQYRAQSGIGFMIGIAGSIASSVSSELVKIPLGFSKPGITTFFKQGIAGGFGGLLIGYLFPPKE